MEGKPGEMDGGAPLVAENGEKWWAIKKRRRIVCIYMYVHIYGYVQEILLS